MAPDRKYTNLDYNPKLKSNAGELRKAMTKAEACLWKYILKEKKMRGYQFYRQRPVLRYIADFMCKELKLIIEIDGITHFWDETLIKDKQKEFDLKNAGFTIIRFRDEEVLKDIRNVIFRLEIWIDEFEGNLGGPPPTLPIKIGTGSPKGDMF